MWHVTKANVGNARELTVETACKKMERVKLLVACRQANANNWLRNNRNIQKRQQNARYDN